MGSEANELRLSLTIFLLRDAQATAAVEKTFFSDQDIISLVEPLNGKFVSIPSAAKTPAWVNAVRSVLAGDIGSPTSNAPAGLMLVNEANRSFVITFGHAWQKLKLEWVEPEFGRRVVLNSIARDQLLEIRAEQVFAKWHLANERAPKASSVEEFGVEFDRDLVAVVEGVPSDDALGKTIRGGTSLRASFSLSKLSANLAKAAALFTSNAYKKTWPEIDNLKPVSDPTLVGQLEAALDAEFLNGKAQKTIVMFTPSHRRGEVFAVDSYVLGRMSETPATVPYLTVQFWLNHLKKTGRVASVAEARATKLHMLDEAKDEIGATDVFSSFGYELSWAGNQYILSSGIWYEVALNFVSRIDKAVKKLPSPKIVPMAWTQTETEGEYNKRVAKVLKCLHFDAKNVQFGGGHSKFEFCDFMHEQTSTLYFAKIASRSSGMSHLTEQVRRTAELLFSADGAYRRKLAKSFVKAYPKADPSWLDSRPKHGDYNLCLVSLGRTAAELPFFARCGLARMAEDLQERGHVVSFAAV